MPSRFEAIGAKFAAPMNGFNYEEKLSSFSSLAYALHVLRDQKSILFLHN